ncbi:MAG: class I SAM-dependent methyltransferase [bacterium]|nr:class I SAM-dependent methyltransferase [bacterium]
MTTDNFRKHSSKNPLQKLLIERFLSVLVDETQALHPVSILDAGCGEGFTLERFRLAGICQRLEGIDLEQRAIDLGRAIHPRLSLTQGNIYQLPYADDSFDAVVCSEVLEHLERPEEALKELCRVASRYTIITVPHEPFFRLANLLRGKNISRWGNDIEHIQHWSAQGIANLVRTEFKVRTVRTPFPWTFVVGEKRT